MAWTMTVHRGALDSCGTAGGTLARPFAAASRLLRGAASAVRRVAGALAAYLPGSRRTVRGWETALGMWGALGEPARARRRGGRSRAEF